MPVLSQADYTNTDIVADTRAPDQREPASVQPSQVQAEDKPEVDMSGLKNEESKDVPRKVTGNQLPTIDARKTKSK